MRTLFGRDGWSMGRCRDCGLLRQNPRVTAASMAATQYDTERTGTPTPRRSRDVGAGLEPWESKPQAAFLAGVAAVEEQRASGAPRGRWIDIGCQTGGMLVAAKRAGYTIAGADVDTHSAAFCREHHDADARDGTLTEAAFPTGSADVISYRHVLEHVHDLEAELAEVHRVLAPGGLLLIEVPHGSGIRLWQDRVLSALRLRARERMLRNVPQHLYYFRARDLRTLLERAGFVVLAERTYGRYRPERSLLRRAYERVRDGLRLGNKLRLVARRP